MIREKRVVCGIATQPSREALASRVVRMLVRQVDLLVVHLDGFPSVPHWARNPKIRVRHHVSRSRAGAAGKLDCLEEAVPGDVILLVDDDIVVNRRLTKRMVEALFAQPKPSVVGAHGSLVRPPLNSFVHDRQVIQLQEELAYDQQVDVLATCLCAFEFDTFVPRPSTWRHRNMVDLQFALDACAQNVSLVSIARKRGEFRFADSFQPGSIFEALINDDSIQTGLAHQLVDCQETSGQFSSR